MQKRQRPEVRLVLGDTVNLGGRRITPDDLIEIGRILAEEAFNHYDCVVIDEQGGHMSDTLDVAVVLDQVLWRSVDSFEINAIQIVDADEDNVGLVRVRGVGYTDVMWSAQQNADRDAIERTYKKVVDFIEGLPTVKKDGMNIFTTTGAEAQRLERPWWDVRRTPKSIADAISVEILGGVVAGVVAGVLTFVLLTVFT